jgi:hypothetical protein
MMRSTNNNVPFSGRALRQFQGAKNNFTMVARPNLDAAVSILKELGRTKGR